MNEVGVTQAVIACLIFLAGLLARFAFDRVGVMAGWAREDRKEQDRRIEAIDNQARASIERVERALGDRLGDVERDLGRIDEHIKHLPSADDLERLNDRLANIDRELSACTAKIDGQGEMVRTIRDHILRGERG